MTFGKAIKEQRIKKGLTQAQLAEMLGKAESTVRTWGLDRSSPDRKALYAMCEIFGITPDYFFYNTTPPDNMDGGLKHSFEVKNKVTSIIGKWTVYQAQKRLPLLELCQDLSEEELAEVINYIKFVQSKRQGGKGEE